MERRGSVAYKLQLPERARIYPIFHVSLLKKYEGKVDGAHMELPPFTKEGVAILEHLSLLDTHWIKQGTNIVEVSLVHWKHLPIEDST